MTWLTQCFISADGAAAASRSIRLRAYVPVFCMLKNDPSHRGAHHGWGPQQGNFKVVCNTPYHMHMHMQGHWEPAGWASFFAPHRKHAQKDLGVEVRLVGHERTLDGRCDLTPGPDGGCRAFDEDDGASPPKLAQAEITVDVPWLAGPRRADARISATTGAPFAVAASEHSNETRWSGRMGLGALPRVASAGEIAYVPRFMADATDGERNDDIFARAADDSAGADAQEHVTVYLTLTGRY